MRPVRWTVFDALVSGAQLHDEAAAPIADPAARERVPRLEIALAPARFRRELRVRAALAAPALRSRPAGTVADARVPEEQKTARALAAPPVAVRSAAVRAAAVRIVRLATGTLGNAAFAVRAHEAPARAPAVAARVDFRTRRPARTHAALSAEVDALPGSRALLLAHVAPSGLVDETRTRRSPRGFVGSRNQPIRAHAAPELGRPRRRGRRAVALLADHRLPVLADAQGSGRALRGPANLQFPVHEHRGRSVALLDAAAVEDVVLALDAAREVRVRDAALFRVAFAGFGVVVQDKAVRALRIVLEVSAVALRGRAVGTALGVSRLEEAALGNARGSGHELAAPALLVVERGLAVRVSEDSAELPVEGGQFP